jgi:hypothetical protein
MHFEVYDSAASRLKIGAGAAALAADWRWRLRAANGQIIATSGEGYTTRENCVHALNLVKSTDARTPVVSV